MFGASASKVFVAATLLDKQRGELKSGQLQLLSDMLVISSNTAWVELQRQIGDGNADRGRQANLDFTTRMGYRNTRGFQGNLGSMHGNELSSGDIAEFLYDAYQGKFAGAETMWKIMHTSRTGVNRAKRYMPSNLFIGSKTGTYSGSTTDPETGHSVNVSVNHQEIVFNAGGKEYAIVVLANTGTDDTAALLAGGLLREYTDAGK
ncbi:MAG: serine hydrolase, partial [Bdellovibrionota bacterium]